MATWVAHLRIADMLMKELKITDHREFIVGNIGPDCGIPNDDWSRFTPPTEVSHWRCKETCKIDYEGFYSRYCQSGSSDFYLGYYVHLLTDHLWAELIHKPKREKYRDEFEKNTKFIWTMKKDWYDLDKHFLNNNDLYAYNEFISIDAFENKYLSFYPDEAFTRQIQYISNFYETRDRNIDREFVYLTEREMDLFVKTSSDKILDNLVEIGAVE